MRAQLTVGIGILLLTTNCFAGRIGPATDLPPTQRPPTLVLDGDVTSVILDAVVDVLPPEARLPDAAATTPRESSSRPERRVETALAKTGPSARVLMAMLGVMIVF